MMHNNYRDLGNETSSKSEIGNKIRELKIRFDELDSLMQTINSVVDTKFNIRWIKPIKNPQQN